MGEIWKAVVGLLITGVPLLAVQVGGRRGLKRRALREDLELLKLLVKDDAHAAVRARLRARVTKKLEQYEPALDVRTQRRARWELAAAALVLTGISAVLVSAFEVTGFWSILFTGAALGIAGNVVLAIVASRRDELAQDQAVAEVHLEGVLRRREARFEMSTEPEETDRGE